MKKYYIDPIPPTTPYPESNEIEENVVRICDDEDEDPPKVPNH